MVTVQTVHARLHYCAEHTEHPRTTDTPLQGLSVLLTGTFFTLFPVFDSLAGFGILHSFNEVSEELMGVLLAPQFKLRVVRVTFLKIDLRFLIILLGE